MDSYIVRIYRRTGGGARILIGTVEEAGARKKVAFSNMEELWEILKRRERRGGPGKKKKAAESGNCGEGRPI